MIITKNKKAANGKCKLEAKNLLYTVLSILLFCSTYSTLKAQVIPQYFWGTNAWMPDSVGNDDSYSGNLHDNWSNVQQSNVKLVRVGGKAYDFNRLSNYQYLKMVDSIRDKGMEPILQVPFGDGDFDTIDAFNIITYINITHSRGVKYWAIGNEPDLWYIANKSATKVAKYIKEYAIVMKKIDPSILIVGPALSYIKPQDSNDVVQKLLDTLTTWNGDSTKNIVGIIPSGNGSATGKGFIDFFDYHMYNYSGADSNTTTRSWLINRLVGTDSARMGWMKRRCDLCSAHRSGIALKPMITEANICTQGNSAPSFDGFGDTKASGFFAGQHWCEAMALALDRGIESIDFWSAMEGNGMGYMTNATPGVKKSTYYHLQAMSKWFTGTHYLGTDNQTNIKAFGSKDGNNIVVMILNQDTVTAAAKNYTIRLDNDTTATTTWIKMNMAVSASYSDSIDASSTTLLEFDLNGNISQKFTYKQSFDNIPPGFQQPHCSDSFACINQTEFEAYAPGVYSDITIGGTGTGQGTISLNATHNTIFRSTGLITITGVGGAFSTNGQPLILTHSDCQ